jgi:hypothetical protein
MAQARMDCSLVTDIGKDETVARRGQDYVSIFMDRQERRVMFANEGREALTVKGSRADLLADEVLWAESKTAPSFSRQAMRRSLFQLAPLY